MEHHEDLEQVAIMRWAGFTRIPGTNEPISNYLIHIPNGGKRNVREATRFKRMGVKAGVADLFLAYPMGTMPGLWLELKKQERHFSTPALVRLSVKPNQREWLERMSAVGYMVDVCFGADAAILRIKSYLGVPL